MDAKGSPATGGLSGARSTLAFLLAALSAAAIAAAALGGSSTREAGQLILIVAPVAWVLAAVVLAPAFASVNAVTFVAVGMYAVAFLLPALSKGNDAFQGAVAFVVGWAVVPVAWAANPVFLLSLAAWRRGSTTAAGAAGALACLLALTALGMPNWNGWGPAVGFWLWAAAPAVVTLASIVVPRPGSDRVDRARPVAV